jgi:hypothetical protein
MVPGAVFTARHFLRNLQMSLIRKCYITLSWSYTGHGQTIQLTWAIHKLRRKLSVVNTTPSRTLQHRTRLEKLGRDKHSSLLRTFVNYGREKFYKFDTKFLESRTGSFSPATSGKRKCRKRQLGPDLGPMLQNSFVCKLRIS